MSIIRKPTVEEQQDFIPLIKGRRRPMEVFNEELHSRMQKCIKSGIPFADQVAKDDWVEGNRQEVRRIMNKYGDGFMTEEALKEYKQPTLEWDKYSDLKNFDLIREDEQHDPQLTKRHGRQIFLKYKVYKFKGYNKTYTVVESFPGAWSDNEKVSELPNSEQTKTKNSKK